MPDIRDTIRLVDRALSDELKSAEYSQALPEVRWVEWSRADSCGMRLQQRWRVWDAENDKEPRHEWRDVPTVKEGS